MSQARALNPYQRIVRYLEQSRRGQLTDRQARRAHKKMNRAKRHRREAK